MKVSLKRMAVLAYVGTMGLLMSSCSEDTIVNNYDITVENVTVEFGAKSLLTESSDVLAKGTAQKTTNFDNSYTHTLPTSFKAYFVSTETRGQYTQGQVVKVIDVTTGSQTITIPKLSYNVYVVNYDHPTSDETQPYAWYTWANPEQQLPVTTSNIILFGKSLIDYKTVTTGQVELHNYHSAVMIKNNVAIGGTPTFNTGNVPYNLVANNDWYLLYIRNATTSTAVPLSFTSPNGTTYQLNKSILANKIYQYTLQAVGDVDGNLTIVTVPMEEGTAEIIDILD